MRAKSILLSTTFWANVVLFLTTLLDSTEALNLVPDVLEPHMVSIIALINVALRFKTKQPVAMKMPDNRDAVV